MHNSLPVLTHRDGAGHVLDEVSQFYVAAQDIYLKCIKLALLIIDTLTLGISQHK